MAELDLLAFGPHADDVEIGLGGTMARHAALGWRTGICDLTRGDLSTNGTPEERLAEAEAARVVLGAAWRGNLGWGDGTIGRDPGHLPAAVAVIRQWRPRTVALPYWADRHPDHVAASELLTEAVFKSGLRRYAPDTPAWRPDWVCYYFINDSAAPSFVIDVSDYYEAKRQALACHRTQFQPAAPGAEPTRLTSPQFRQLIESRDAQFGALAGVIRAEGLVVKTPIVRPHLFRAHDSRGGSSGGGPAA
ncbi:MAG: bacillithiol biosynthesis deacetylase BshB1 [Acidobacteriota bacterium]|nr:bacillithiol biosynthesis deacetylase BshB1 [Acidobacteriota bacterium]